MCDSFQDPGHQTARHSDPWGREADLISLHAGRGPADPEPRSLRPRGECCTDLPRAPLAGTGGVRELLRAGEPPRRVTGTVLGARAGVKGAPWPEWEITRGIRCGTRGLQHRREEQQQNRGEAEPEPQQTTRTRSGKDRRFPVESKNTALLK